MNKQPKKREVDVVIISDVHLGTYGCHARELLNYLKSVKPKMLILNGDIIDIWQFTKRYWPEAHMKVVKRITSLIAKGVPVYYLPGNHDDMLRKFSDFEIGSFKLLDKLMLNVNGQKAWIFHGDVFDVTMHAKWLAKLGGHGYDILILLNRLVNFISQKVLGKGKISLSKKIKDSVKGAIKFVDDFEQTAADLAIEKGYQYVICGHIHKPQDKLLSSSRGSVRYLNSGDWVENLTALELNNGTWQIYYYNEDPFAKQFDKDFSEGVDEDELKHSDAFVSTVLKNITK